jgi:hypothetical protein
MKLKLFIICALSLLIQACQSAPIILPIKPSVIDVALVDAIETIALAYENLAAVESRAQSDKVTQAEINSLQGIWQRPVIILNDFSGELTDFIRLLSMNANLKDPIIQYDKKINVLVSFTKGQRPLVDVLANAGYQAGARAVITLDAAGERIVVNYPYSDNSNLN